MKKRKILVTGASGLVGKALVNLLNERGHAVRTLGRTKEKDKTHFVWDIENGDIDARALDGVDAIVHLAGAGVADSRWTATRKKEILDSRVQGAKLLFEHLKKNKNEVKNFISASAVGYYGDAGDKWLDESEKPGKGFLSDVCMAWEDGAIAFEKLGIREVRCRIGIVLANGGGALPELTRPMSLGAAPYFAKSSLYYSWIHLQDVCGIFLHAIENENLSGALNTTAPEPLLQKELVAAIVEAKKSIALLVPTPPLAIKLAMGEMSEMLLSSQRCSAHKILASGYRFQFPDLKSALQDLFPSSVEGVSI